jgi:hypothetical protein
MIQACQESRDGTPGYVERHCLTCLVAFNLVVTMEEASVLRVAEGSLTFGGS